jgi:2-dehydropantoate 2-reductase
VRIAVVGCGAVGSFYGARLARSGHEVHFLLRSDYDVVRRNGISIRSPQGDFHIQPKASRLPHEIGPCDLVVIGLKTTANSQFPILLPPLVAAGTALVTLQNGLGNEERLARLFPGNEIFGGLCFVCLNRIEPGIIHHIAHGLIVLGRFLGRPDSRTEELADAFRNAGVPCKITDNLARTHWEKLVWNIPFNGLGVASAAGYDALTASLAGLKLPSKLEPCLTTDKLLSDSKWTGLVRELMLEVIAAARAIGFPLPDDVADEQIVRTRTMGAYKASTLLDFERRQPLELESLFLEPLRQAQRAGLEMPRLAKLCAVLTRLGKGKT